MTIVDLFSLLPKEDQALLQRIYGIGGAPVSMADIARSLGGISRERVRQKKERALSRFIRIIRVAGAEDLARMRGTPIDPILEEISPYLHPITADEALTLVKRGARASRVARSLGVPETAFRKFLRRRSHGVSGKP